jgi:hypothetical protein
MGNNSVAWSPWSDDTVTACDASSGAQVTDSSLVCF